MIFPNKVNQEQFKSLEEKVSRIDRKVDNLDVKMDVKLERTKNEMIMWYIGSVLALGIFMMSYVNLSKPKYEPKLQTPQIIYIQPNYQTTRNNTSTNQIN